MQQNEILERQETRPQAEKPLKKRKLPQENRAVKKSRDAAVSIATDSFDDHEENNSSSLSTAVTQADNVLNITSRSSAPSPLLPRMGTPSPASPLPPRMDTLSPFCEHNLSPFREHNQSPFREHHRSPLREHNRSPLREHIRSPLREHIRSPLHEHIRSPLREHIRSPLREHIRSPLREHTQSVSGTSALPTLAANLDAIYDFDEGDDDSVIIHRHNIRASTPVQAGRKVEVSEDVLSQMLDRIDSLERKTEELQHEVRILKQASVVSNTGRKSIRPETLVNVAISDADVVKLQPSDTSVPVYFVDQETLQRTKQQSRSKRRFVAEMTRMMFSIHERSRETNVNGRQQRGMLSPTKGRFQRICDYTATLFNENINDSLTREVTTVIDETNRRYRDELKLRKFRANFSQ